MWQTIVFFAAFLTFAAARTQQKPIVLTEDDWDGILKGEWMVKFYAPWCPACKALAPTWERVAGWSEDLEINVAHVDVTENPGLSGRFMVMSLPTIFHVKDGKFRMYRGSREENKIISFVDDAEWVKLDEVAWYRNPNSYQMAAVGKFFQMAMQIRNLHSMMTEELGLPVWGSYTLFAVLTIVVGLVLGLVLVCVCDQVFPPTPLPEPTQYKKLERRPTGTADREDIKDNESDILDDRQEPVGAEDEVGSTKYVRKRKPRID